MTDMPSSPADKGVNTSLSFNKQQFVILPEVSFASDAHWSQPSSKSPGQVPFKDSLEVATVDLRPVSSYSVFASEQPLSSVEMLAVSNVSPTTIHSAEVETVSEHTCVSQGPVEPPPHSPTSEKRVLTKNKCTMTRQASAPVLVNIGSQTDVDDSSQLNGTTLWNGIPRIQMELADGTASVIRHRRSHSVGDPIPSHRILKGCSSSSFTQYVTDGGVSREMSSKELMTRATPSGSDYDKRTERGDRHKCPWQQQVSTLQQRLRTVRKQVSMVTYGV